MEVEVDGTALTQATATRESNKPSFPAVLTSVQLQTWLLIVARAKHHQRVVQSCGTVGIPGNKLKTNGCIVGHWVPQELVRTDVAVCREAKVEPCRDTIHI